MNFSDPKLQPLDATAMAAVLKANRVRWGWDDKVAAMVFGKLARGKPAIRPLDRNAAATIVSMCAEGGGLNHALKATRVTFREYYAWIAKSHTVDPDAGPYRAFRDDLLAAYAQNIAKTGIADPKGSANAGLI